MTLNGKHFLTEGWKEKNYENSSFRGRLQMFPQHRYLQDDDHIFPISCFLKKE